MRSMVQCLVLVAAMLAVSGRADIPKLVSYQGKVTDAAGTPVADGAYNMRFRIYDVVTGGTSLWDSGIRSIALADGIFNVMLGESPQPALNLDFDVDYWLLVTFNSVDQTPRQRLASSGYAYMASGLVPGTHIEAAISGSTISATNTQASGWAYGGEFNTSESGTGAGVLGRNWCTVGTDNYGGYFLSWSPNGSGVKGYTVASTGQCNGVLGLTDSPTGRGVYGVATATTGVCYGGSFETASTSGNGVRGAATATTGTCYGGYFETASTSGTGVRGVATSTTGVTYGVFGRVYSTTDDSRGVYGRSYATSGLTYGVYGRTDSDGGIGVYGVATSTEASSLSYGVYGVGNMYNGTGVYGEGNVGGRFECLTNGNSALIATAAHSGGYFEDTYDSYSYAYVAYSTYKIMGNGSVDFVQNHPYESDRVIVYAAPEGDEVATYTRGTARLDNGEARVSLGETFAWVTSPDVGLTAHVTPRGQCEGLFVESLTTTDMVVRELRDGRSDVVFDYIVYGLRNGFEQVSVVQEKTREAPVPSMADHLNRYLAYPELRQYNPLERFKAMYQTVGNRESLPGER